jgi:hypothetical protein
LAKARELKSAEPTAIAAQTDFNKARSEVGSDIRVSGNLSVFFRRIEGRIWLLRLWRVLWRV